MFAKVVGISVAAAAAVPAQMPAYVAKSIFSQGSQASFRTPALGDLHEKFTKLPACEVLVEVSHSSVNPCDRSAPGPYPQVMGSDIAGTVVDVQDSCTKLKVGDKVWGDIGAVTKPSGKENGGYAPYALGLESQLGKMPKNLDFDEAAALPKVALTGYKAFTRFGGAPFKSGKGVVLILGGSGGTGTSGIQLAKALGATKVITTTSAANADYVKSLGADEVIDYHSANWWEVLADGSVDTIYDCVGQSGTGDRAMKKLANGGYFVSITGQRPSSVPSGKHAATFINSDDNLDNLDLLEALRGFVEAGKLRMPSRKSYDLAKVPDAFKESKAGHVVGKLNIKMPTVEQVEV
jgi:NADPH:quinone reductase-like Zn-dependent oxidoreductase